MLAPILFYVYQYAPDDSDVWETKWFTLTSGGYNTVQGYLYIVCTKAFIFFIVSTWYLTCMHWWKHAILVPLAIVLYQFTMAVNDNVQYIDEFSVTSSLPIVIPILILHIVIARKLKFLNDSLDVKEQIDSEIQDFINN